MNRCMAADEGLFVREEGSNVFLPAPKSDAESLRKFTAFGKTMAIALVNNAVVQLPLASCVWKFLVSGSARCDWHDLADVDEQLHRSLEQLLLFRVSSDPGDALNFTVALDGRVIELKPFGSEINVNDVNKREYVEMYADFKLVGCRLKAMESIRSGLFSDSRIRELVSRLPHWALPVLLCGTTMLTFDMLSPYISFTGFPSDSKTKSGLLKFLGSASSDLLKRFVQFATGLTTIPLDGLRNARGEETKIQVVRSGLLGQLPASHTCSFAIDLPDYNDEEVVAAKMKIALEFGAGGAFGAR